MSSQKNRKEPAAEIFLGNPIDAAGLVNKYAEGFTIKDINIGYDDRIYILLIENIPEMIRSGFGVFVDPSADSGYSVIELTVDWESGELLNSEFYDLGELGPNFHFIQPIGDKLLLVGARTYYREDSGGDDNGFIIDRNGAVSEKFCFGDGIQDCIVLSDGRIVTSYFDEGVYGNYGWRRPVGCWGLVVWNENGEIIWEARNHRISDCYAMNTDEKEDLWFYYYDDFNLVRTDLKTETVYEPGIAGSNSFLITKDSRYVIFDAGYDKHGQYVYAPVFSEKIGGFKPMEFVFDGEKNECIFAKFHGSKAVLSDDGDRIFAKEIPGID